MAEEIKDKEAKKPDAENTPKNNKGGRPKKVIDYETVEKLASIMCTQEEIASFLDISTRTLQRNKEFCRIYKKGLESGKMSLRRSQFNMAQTNTTMAIWLGKQYLGQTDKNEVKNDNIKVEIVNDLPNPDDD